MFTSTRTRWDPRKRICLGTDARFGRRQAVDSPRTGRVHRVWDRDSEAACETRSGWRR